MNALLLSASFLAPYRVLRCAAQAGSAVHVLGTKAARPLALSRYCTRFEEFTFDTADEHAARAIDEYAEAHGIGIVLPSDAPTTRFLCTMGSRLKANVFPLPTLGAFQQLVTKDRFRDLCMRLGLPHPETRMFEDRDALCAALGRGELRLPAMFKPVNRAGSIGVVRAGRQDALAIAAKLEYAPILVQDFVDGTDVSISVVCEAGRIRRQAIYLRRRDTFHFIRQENLSALVARIAEALALTGVINFDSRVAPDGRVWLIECNPRFFFNVDVVMLAGENFADPEQRGEGPARMVSETRVRLSQDIFRRLLGGHLPDARDRRVLGHWLADPLMYLLIALGYGTRWSLPALEELAAVARLGIGADQPEEVEPDPAEAPVTR